MIYGYIRVSTEQQNTVNQKHEISTFADKNELQIDKWVDETISSRKPLKERKLGSLIKKLKKGDILIASELSRLGRNLMEVMGILQKCLENECQVWMLKENYRLGGEPPRAVFLGNIPIQRYAEKSQNRFRYEEQTVG